MVHGQLEVQARWSMIGRKSGRETQVHGQLEVQVMV